MIKRLLKYLALAVVLTGCSKGGGTGNMDWNVFRVILP